MDQLWTEKYRPQTLGEVVGHDQILESCRTWLGSDMWKARSLLLWGPAGSGKTTITHALCNEFNYQCVEYNASELRTASAIRQIRSNTVNTHSVESFFQAGKPKRILILLDEVDGLTNSESFAELVRWICDPKRVVPLCFTCNSVNAQLRKHCHTHLVMGPNPNSVRSYLQRICRLEEIKYPEDLEDIVRLCKGDLRQAVVMLQFGNREAVPPQRTPVQCLLATSPTYSNIAELNSILYGVLLHPNCPLEALESWRYLNPVPHSVKDLVGLNLGSIKPDTEQSPYSMLSQWNLWKK